MKKTLLKTALAFSLFAASLHANAQSMFGLNSNNQIWTMANVSSPSTVSGPYTVSGVVTGQILVALDSRQSNGSLYALGYDSVTSTAQLYTITGSGSSYAATKVGAAISSMSFGSMRSIGFDFISTLDNQIRITGTNGNSYVMNADNGTLISSGTNTMSYAAGDLHAGISAALGATSYTNNYYGSDATDQYAFDVTTGLLVHFDDANYYNNTNNYPNTVHSVGLTSGLNLSAGSSVGMDNWYDNTTHSNSIYLAAKVLLSSGSHLYKMDKLTGLGTDMGAIGSGSFDVRDIAFASTRDNSNANSSIQGQLMAALTLNTRSLIFFDSHNPSYIRHMAALSGMTSGQAMLAVAYGFDQKLYGIGYNSANQTYQLYTIDSASGRVTAVNNSAGSLNLGSGNNSYGNEGYNNIGFNFIGNTTDRIRLIGNNGNTNVILNATTGAIVETDSSIRYMSGDANYGSALNLGSIGYENSYPGSTSSNMIGFDVTNGAMVTLNSNGGNNRDVSTTLSLNSLLNIFNTTSGYRNGYMDILYDQNTSANLGFMASNYYGDSSRNDNYSTFYVLSGLTSSSTATSAGSIGDGTPVKTLSAKKALAPTAVYNVTGKYNNALLIYPNPATNSTRVVLPKASTDKVYVDIIDLNGRIVSSNTFAAGSYQLDVNVSNIPTGLYSVRVFSNNMTTQNLKLIKE